MIRPAVVLLLLSACQAEPPAGPASLQIVPPGYYSRSLRYHGGSAIRGEVAQPQKPRDGTITVIVPADAAPEHDVQDALIEQLARIQGELKRLRERIDWQQNSGAWRPAPGKLEKQ
mgnify:CR=1 FL=1